MAKTPSSTTPAELTPEAVGKGHATPTRKEKEAARKQPLVSSDRAAARKKAREQTLVQRERARVGMAAGDEKYLPIRDRGPQKRYVRDYVDARFSVGELLIPLMFVVILLTLIPAQSVATYGTLAIWAFFIVVVIDSVILGFRLNRLLAEKFGAGKVEKVRWYAAMRAVQLRLMRLPKPQVKRGQYPA